MSVIRVHVEDQVLRIIEAPTIASGGQNEAKVAFTFCEKWDGYSKTAVFYQDEANPYFAVLNADDVCVMPWEVCHEVGTLYIGVFGDKDGVRRTSTVIKYKVRRGAITDDAMPSDPSPEVYDQIMSAFAEAKAEQDSFIETATKTVQELEDARDRGDFDGFTPTLYWSEDGEWLTIIGKNGTTTQKLKGDKGDKGEDGYTPVKGVDYFDGEQGIQGIQGIPGEKGETGATGEKGETGDTGKSAYQIAVDHGFQGTEREWVESLKGYSRLVVFIEHTFGSIAPGSTKYLSGSRDLVVGETYHVIWGNEEYTCVAVQENGDFVTIGNLGLIADRFINNGLPFVMQTNPRDSYLYVGSAEAHTDLYMCIFQETKINGLPDVTAADNGKVMQVVEGVWTAVEPEEDDSDTAVVLDTLMDDTKDSAGKWLGEATDIDTSDATLIIGNTYRYIYDGQSYESVCVEYNGLPAIGNIPGYVNNQQHCFISRDIPNDEWVCHLHSIPSDYTGRFALQIYNLGRILPAVTDSDNGKILQVSNGVWTPAELGDLKGEDGYTPVKGVDYFDGQDGKDGADGKSAYQIAQEHGFEGTEEEWLESLKGEGGSSRTVILEEQELAFVNMDGDVGAMIFEPNPIVLGEAYTVIWDGTEYNCTAVEVNGLPIIGNAAINGGEDDGIPFVIGYVPTEVTGDDPMLNLLSLYDTADATHTVGIYQEVKPLTKADVVSIVNQVIEEALGGEY